MLSLGLFYCNDYLGDEVIDMFSSLTAELRANYSTTYYTLYISNRFGNSGLTLNSWELLNSKAASIRVLRYFKLHKSVLDDKI
mmetsp:Transcript_4348/g.584  ORF Transcript_4348/g.584 Transcript_4348/m.584 type:complete len:83 (-) Transcript_4348:775-1023(-)